MTLVITKCSKDGRGLNYIHTYRQANIGDRVTCNNWNDSLKKDGSGFYGLKDGNGDWNKIVGKHWLVIDADDKIIHFNENECKFNTGIVKFRGPTIEFIKTDFFKKMTLDSKKATSLAREIRNTDFRSEMIKYVVTSEDAYNWACFIGDRNKMLELVTESKWAYWWAKSIGYKNDCLNKINDSEYAYYWAYYIGDVDIMKSKVTEEFWIEKWNKSFPNNKIESE